MTSASAGIPTAPPKSAEVLFEATYYGKISGFGITMVRTLTQESQDQYVFSSKAENLFSFIEETSAFKLKTDAVEISDYQYLRSIAKNKTAESIHYNWEQMQATYSRDQKDFPLALGKNFLDPSLYQLFLQVDVSQNLSPLKYAFLKRKRIEHYTFERLDDDTLAVGKKKYKALVVLRKSASKNRQTKVWFIPELDYQIGKIEHTDKKGSDYMAYLKHYSSNKPLLSEFLKKAAVAHSTNTPQVKE